MSVSTPSDSQYRRELGDQLVLRWSTPTDVGGVGALYSYVFRDTPNEPPNQRVIAWSRDMLEGRHPLIAPDDFALVEDQTTGAIVAATCLICQQWEYDGIRFSIGRPEVVATHPDYRNRGLIRAIFDIIHARSAARGHLALGITGIPYYYRQFEYEYAIDLGGGWQMLLAAIPELKENEPEPYHVRMATPADLTVVMRLYEREYADCQIRTPIEEPYWRFCLNGHTPGAGEGLTIALIFDTNDRPVGYVITRSIRWGDTLPVLGLVVEEGVSMMAVLPSTLRWLKTYAEQTPVPTPNGPPARQLQFLLGRSHRLYSVLPETMGHRIPPYAWYVRVADLPAFIRHIAPVLERRLANSVVDGYTGELKLNFYRDGLRMAFEAGKLAEVSRWRSEVWGPKPQAGFPPLVFLQLLFGRRTLSELQYAFPDVWADDTSVPVLTTLFPSLTARVMPLD